MLHYRAAQHTTTDSSPALLMLGRELSLPLDRLRVPAHLTSQGAQGKTTDQLRDRVSARQQATKQRFDRSHRAKHPVFTILDWVRVRRPTRGHKLLSFWSAPFQVTGTCHLSPLRPNAVACTPPPQSGPTYCGRPRGQPRS